MRYYLGYYDNLEFKPIELEEVKPTILSIVRFTTNFDSLNSLKKYLLMEQKIPNNDVTIHYLIEKGKKSSKYYEPLKTNKIYTFEYSSVFSVDGIKKLINNNKYDEELIVLLLGEYLKKFGYMNSIIEFIKNQEYDIQNLIILLKELYKITSSSSKSAIEYILNNYQTQNNNELNYRLEYLFEQLKYNNGDLVNIYLYLRRYINFRNIPTIKYLNSWFRIANNYNRTTNFYNDIPSEYCNIDSEINNFLSSIIYDYDSGKGEYKKVNGRRKIQERQLFDLGGILSSYHKKLYDKHLDDMYKEDDTYDEDAEFLCESDFERIGTTSEETGIKIRKIRR